MKKIMLVFGTRPEAIKMCPLVIELKKYEEFQVITVVSGQHKEMLEQILVCFQVIPEYNLHVMKPGQTLTEITSDVLQGMKRIYEKEHPDLVLVHGDTTTAFASALQAFYMDIPVGHVEAGLRTYHLRSPFPEEFNRQAIGSLATYHFAPTQTAVNHLLTEQKNPKNVYLTGNTVIDALKTTVQETYDHPILQWAKGSRLVLLTAHRRENLGAPMRQIFEAILRVLAEHEDVKLVYPVHLNPLVQKTADEIFAGCDRIMLTEPLQVIDFHNVMNRSYLIMTDSGGIQEEAPALGKPVLVLRDTTERPEGVEAGTLKLVGTNKEAVYQAFTTLLENKEEYQKMQKAINPYGDGTASYKIAQVLLNWGKE